MKFFYVVALLVPAALAADQALSNEKVDELRDLIHQECTDLPPDCAAAIEKLLANADKFSGWGFGRRDGAKNRECFVKAAACARKVGPKFLAAHGPFPV